jgi:hypothetical protein
VVAFSCKARAVYPSQKEVEALVEKVSKRILRFLERRGVLTLVTAPGDGEVTDERPVGKGALCGQRHRDGRERLCRK